MDKNKIRWLGKRLIRLFPKRKKVSINQSKNLNILYLFSGTYGDFAQCLTTLEKINQVFPKGNTYILCKKSLHSFKPILPETVKFISLFGCIKYLLKPSDILFTNTIGVYRTIYDLMAYKLSRASFGFCYGDEVARPTWNKCIPLKGVIKNFEIYNESLIDLALGKKSSVNFKISKRPISKKLNLEKQGLTFHIGSSGLKRDMGIENYCLIIDCILSYLRENKIPVTILSGPGDEEVLEFVNRSWPGLKKLNLSLSELKDFLCKTKSKILCFNSFLGHFTWYLNISATVVHYINIPIGYDCSPLHSQIVIDPNSKNPLEELYKTFSVEVQIRNKSISKQKSEVKNN